MSSIDKLGTAHHKKLNRHYRMRNNQLQINGFNSDSHTMERNKDGIWIKKPYIPKTKPSTKVSDTIYFGFTRSDTIIANPGELLEYCYYGISYIISENTKRLGNKMSNKNFHKEMIRLLALGKSEVDVFNHDLLQLTEEQINKIDSENTFTVKQSVKIKQVYHTKIPNKIREMLGSESLDIQNVGLKLLLNMILDNKLRHRILKKNTSKYLTKIKK